MVRKAAGIYRQTRPLHARRSLGRRRGADGLYSRLHDRRIARRRRDGRRHTTNRKSAAYLRETADAWNDSIERWTYVEGSNACPAGRREWLLSADRAARAARPARLRSAKRNIKIPNLAEGPSEFPADAIVSVDALALVRFGLRAADDPRIVNTVRVIDAVLKVETPKGPCWHRYNHDGYGEHEDGSPFDGSGIGRALAAVRRRTRRITNWPPANMDEARRLLEVMEALASDTGLDFRASVGRCIRSRKKNCSPAGPAARPGRWSGPTPSMSSCCDRSPTAKCSTCRRKRSSAIWSRSNAVDTRPVATRCGDHAHCAGTNVADRNRRARHACDGASTAGKPPKTPTPATRSSGCSSPICRSARYPPARKSFSRCIGSTPEIGKAAISLCWWRTCSTHSVCRRRHHGTLR